MWTPLLRLIVRLKRRPRRDEKSKGDTLFQGSVNRIIIFKNTTTFFFTNYLVINRGKPRAWLHHFANNPSIKVYVLY